jgi:hypothetical protein
LRDITVWPSGPTALILKVIIAPCDRITGELLLNTPAAFGLSGNDANSVAEKSCGGRATERLDRAPLHIGVHLTALGCRGRVADCENENRDAQNEIEGAENHDRNAACEISIDAPEDETKGAGRKHLLGHGFGQTLAPAFSGVAALSSSWKDTRRSGR